MICKLVILFLQVLCGNKADLTTSRVVTTEEGLEAADRLNLGFLETSAKSGQNVHEAFQELVRRVPRTGQQYKVCSFDLDQGKLCNTRVCPREICHSRPSTRSNPG